MHQSKQFLACVDIVLEHEGGFVQHQDDPGGATNLGITHRTLAAWRGVPSVSVAQVRTLDRGEAIDIYHAQYWGPVQGDKLAPGVAMVLFDMAVNAGPSRAVKLMQDMVGVNVDGHLGTLTLAAINSMPSGPVISGYSAARMAYYNTRPHRATFLKGWSRRVERTRSVAVAMGAGRKPVADPSRILPTPRTYQPDLSGLAVFFDAIATIFRRLFA